MGKVLLRVFGFTIMYVWYEYQRESLMSDVHYGKRSDKYARSGSRGKVAYIIVQIKSQMVVKENENREKKGFFYWNCLLTQPRVTCHTDFLIE